MRFDKIRHIMRATVEINTNHSLENNVAHADLAAGPDLVAHKHRWCVFVVDRRGGAQRQLRIRHKEHWLAYICG